MGIGRNHGSPCCHPVCLRPALLWSGRGSGRQGGARHCTNDLDALGRDCSALPGSMAGGMGAPALATTKPAPAGRAPSIPESERPRRRHPHPSSFTFPTPLPRVAVAPGCWLMTWVWWLVVWVRWVLVVWSGVSVLVVGRRCVVLGPAVQVRQSVYRVSRVSSAGTGPGAGRSGPEAGAAPESPSPGCPGRAWATGCSRSDGHRPVAGPAGYPEGKSCRKTVAVMNRGAPRAAAASPSASPDAC